MSRYWLNPRGRSTYGLALCARCSRKFFLDELKPDPNFSGLLVCDKDRDVLDPWRLPAPAGEQISLPMVRPEQDRLTYRNPRTSLTPSNVPDNVLLDELGLPLEDENGNWLLAEDANF